MRRTVVSALTLGTVLLLFCQPVTIGSGFLANGLLPPVPIPPDNQQTDAKIKLGKQLYFDKRLSSDSTISCASCHQPDAGWADTTPTSEGVEHKRGGRNSPSVLNGAYVVPQFWDGRAIQLEKQAVGPVANPVEMDLPIPDMLKRLNSIPGYVSQFKEVFGTEATEEAVAKAIASFERTVISTNSPYDRYIQGDRSAMSRSAVRGMKLFNGKGHCTACHSGPTFSDSRFHNLGIGYKDGKYADVGRYEVTKDPVDMGAFRTPTMRSVALTPPYLHDGSEKTLMDVINLYNRGGVPNPNMDPLMLPLNLTPREKADLVEFLTSLTGAPIPNTLPELPE